MMIEYVDKIVDMRRHLVQEESRFPAELTRTFKGMETQSNPWGVDAAQRDAWAEGLDIPTMADKPDAEYLYYVGCAGSFDDRAKRTTQALAKILKKAGVDFAILGEEETVQRRDGAAHRQRIPLPDDGADVHRGAQRLQREEDPHQLPALLQHAEERVPAVRRQLRGRSRHRVRASSSSPRGRSSSR